jgi:chemotaxis signal transduction protein
MDISPTETEQLLLVRGGARRWALPVTHVLHVGPLGPLLRLPHASRFFSGAVAHRGEVLPVFDLARLLGTEDPTAAVLALVRRAGQTIGLRLAGIEGIGRFAGTDATILDLDALDVPAPRRRPVVSSAAPRRTAATAPPRFGRGLRVSLAGQAFWLPLDQVVEVLDAAEPVAVPWADPRAPAILMLANEAIAVVRLDLLLHLPSAPASPMPSGTMPPGRMPPGMMVVCRVRRGRVAIRVDSVEGLSERGATPEVGLEMLLDTLPGAQQAAVSPPVPPAPSESAAYLAIVLAAQPCLLPLRSVRSVAAHVRPSALPGPPPNLVGMRAMGGQILPVVDARAMLRLADDEPARVVVEVVPPDGPAFVLAVQQFDGIVRLAAPEIHATDFHSTGGHSTGRHSTGGHSTGGEAVGGVVRLRGRLAWLLIPSALAPRFRMDE